jgi:hypothetical protein
MKTLACKLYSIYFNLEVMTKTQKIQKDNARKDMKVPYVPAAKMNISVQELIIAVPNARILL